MFQLDEEEATWQGLWTKWRDEGGKDGRMNGWKYQEEKFSRIDSVEHMEHTGI